MTEAARVKVTCLEEEHAGRRAHAWQSTGLDIIDDVLCSTRRCVWCQRAEHRPYGPAKPRAWQVTS